MKIAYRTQLYESKVDSLDTDESGKETMINLVFIIVFISKETFHTVNCEV